MRKLSIVLTNDDGAHANGLEEFARALGTLGDVITIVPEIQRSGVGHSMSISTPLKVHQTGDNTYVTSGFPSDCVKFALCRILDTPPDIIVSGINQGQNTGVSVFYSGTVGGAREGALNGITSFAVSVPDECDTSSLEITDTALDVINAILEQDVPAGSLFNINIPSADHRGIKITRQGLGSFQEELVVCSDPRNRPYFWFSGTQNTDGEEDTDVVLFREGYITITPLKCDETDEAMIDRIKGL